MILQYLQSALLGTQLMVFEWLIPHGKHSRASVTKIGFSPKLTKKTVYFSYEKH
jgi:hypothetical protein